MDSRENKLNVAAIIFVIFAIIVFGFLIYNLFFSKNNNGNNKQNEDKNDVINDEYVEVSLNDSSIKNITRKIEFESYVLANLYYNDKFTAETIDNDILLRIGYSKISGYWDDDLTNGNIYSKGTKMYRKIYTSALDKNIKNLFGDNVHYSHRSFKAASYGLSDALGGLGFLEYNISNKYYFTEFEQGGGMNPVAMQRVYKAEKNDNEIRIFANIYFMYKGDSTIYKDYTYNGDGFEELLNPQSCVNIDECSENLNQYIYIFAKNDGDYYLSSFNRI